MEALLVVRASMSETAFGLKASIRAVVTIGIPALALTGIALSSSRSAFVALFVSLVILGSLRIMTARRRSSRFAGFVLMTCLLGALAFLVVTNQMAARFENLSTPQKMAAEAPLREWKTAWKVFSAYPVVGCGLGAYRTATGLITPGDPSPNAHSDYLQVLAEVGFAGTLLVAGLAFFALKAAVRGVLASSDEGSRALSISCVASLGAALLVCTVETNLYLPVNAIVLCWIAGIAAGLTSGHRAVHPLQGARGIHSVYA